MTVGRLSCLLLGMMLVCCGAAECHNPPDNQPAMLTGEAFERAASFIDHTARPLERALFAFHFAHGSREAVIEELAKFQNRDGGFASDLESDTRWPGSAPLGTMKALRILNELGAPVDDAHVKAAVRYLLASFDYESGYWHALPKQANSAPHAPWWEVHQDTGACEVESQVFPTAAIAGYLQAYSTLLPQGFSDRITKLSLDYLYAAPARMPMPNIEVLSELVRLLPQAKRAGAVSKLRTVLDAVVVRDAKQWGTYNAQPLTYVPNPDSPFYTAVENAVPANLDYIISTQKTDGGWGLTWSWEKNDPVAWKLAEAEWRGVVTLENLEKLEAFRRISH
jgi:hypothetical protein